MAASVITLAKTHAIEPSLMPPSASIPSSAFSAISQSPKAGLSRSRLTWLRMNRVPADLERFWMGHENETVGDDYSKVKDDVEFHLEYAEKVGLGFEIPKTPTVVRIVRKNEASVKTENAA
jgi:hypothetical protein